MAGNGHVFAATGVVADLAPGTGDRPGYFVGVDTPVGRSLGEIPRLAIGAGGMRAAFFAAGEALVDAVIVGLVGDDENAAVGRCNRGGEEERARQKRGNGSHTAPMNERATPHSIRPKP